MNYKKLLVWIKNKTSLAATCFFTPWKFISAPGKTLKEKIINLIRQEFSVHRSPRHAAASIACGVLFGLLPIQGFQTASTLAAAILLRLNKVLALLGVCISSPPLVPIWLTLGYLLGSSILPSTFLKQLLHHFPATTLPWPLSLVVHKPVTLDMATGFLQWVAGSIVMAFSISTMAFIIFFFLFRQYSRIAGKNRPPL